MKKHKQKNKYMNTDSFLVTKELSHQTAHISGQDSL